MKKYLGFVKDKAEDSRAKNATLTTHTLKVIEARKRNATKAARMITTHDLKRTR